MTDKIRMPGTDQINIAVEWLKNNEGENGEADNKEAEPLLFRFDGGVGAMMPLKIKYEQHREPFGSR